jgi:hypothetical protein
MTTGTRAVTVGMGLWVVPLGRPVGRGKTHLARPIPAGSIVIGFLPAGGIPARAPESMRGVPGNVLSAPIEDLIERKATHVGAVALCARSPVMVTLWRDSHVNPALICQVCVAIAGELP